MISAILKENWNVYNNKYIIICVSAKCRYKKIDIKTNKDLQLISLYVSEKISTFMRHAATHYKSERQNLRHKLMIFKLSAYCYVFYK